MGQCVLNNVVDGITERTRFNFSKQIMLCNGLLPWQASSCVFPKIEITENNTQRIAARNVSVTNNSVFYGSVHTGREE